MIGALRQKGVTIDAVALVPDKDEMEKLSAFTQEYVRSVRSLNEVGTIKADGIVVDANTDLQPALFAWLEKQGLPVFALDWYYKTGKSVVAMINLRGSVEALRYAIIRREFHKARQMRSATALAYDAVAVIGGGDNRGFLKKLFDYFSNKERFAGKRIVIVLGPLANTSFQNDAGESGGIVTFLRTPHNIAEIMANASVGISNGGTSLMEFTMLGVPTIIFPQSKQEDDFIMPFLEQGTAILGSVDKETFCKSIEDLWADTYRLSSMSNKSRTLIDGRGLERVSAAILDRFYPRRISTISYAASSERG